MFRLLASCLYRIMGRSSVDIIKSGGDQVLRACEMASELAYLVWRKSLIEKGTLTPAYTREAKRVVIAYLDAVLAATK